MTKSFFICTHTKTASAGIPEIANSSDFDGLAAGISLKELDGRETLVVGMQAAEEEVNAEVGDDDAQEAIL